MPFPTTNQSPYGPALKAYIDEQVALAVAAATEAQAAADNALATKADAFTIELDGNQVPYGEQTYSLHTPTIAQIPGLEAVLNNLSQAGVVVRTVRDGDPWIDVGTGEPVDMDNLPPSSLFLVLPQGDESNISLVPVDNNGNPWPGITNVGGGGGDGDQPVYLTAAPIFDDFNSVTNYYDIYTVQQLPDPASQPAGSVYVLQNSPEAVPSGLVIVTDSGYARTIMLPDPSEAVQIPTLSGYSDVWAEGVFAYVSFSGTGVMKNDPSLDSLWNDYATFLADNKENPDYPDDISLQFAGVTQVFAGVILNVAELIGRTSVTAVLALQAAQANSSRLTLLEENFLTPIVPYTGNFDGSLIELNMASDHVVTIPNLGELTTPFSLTNAGSVPIGTRRRIFFEPGADYYNGFFSPVSVNGQAFGTLPFVLTLTRYENGWYSDYDVHHFPRDLIVVDPPVRSEEGLTLPQPPTGFYWSSEISGSPEEIAPGFHPKESLWDQGEGNYAATISVLPVIPPAGNVPPSFWMTEPIFYFSWSETPL